MNKITLGFIAIIVLALAIVFFGHNYALAQAIGIPLLLTTVGGLIAYYGDIIGHTIGKKRLSSFNLRPRETAVVWTIAAGCTSALLTFVTLLSFDVGFRRAVLEGPHLVARNIALASQIRTMDAEVDHSKAAAAQADAAEAQAEQTEAAAVSEEHQTVSELRQTQASLTSATGRLKLAQANLELTAAQLGTAHRDLNLTRAERDQLQKQRRQVAKALASVEVSLAAEKRDLTFIEGLTEHDYTIQRANRLIYDNEQEVGRVVVANGSADDILANLNSFLDRMSIEAAHRGAAPDETTHRAVRVATVEVLTQGQPGSGSQAKGQTYGEKENLQALADQIHDAAQPSVVVIAYSFGNSFEQATVLVRLQPYINRLAVPKGTMVAQTVVHSDGQTDPDELVGSIQALLVRQARPYAIRQGVIPVKMNASQQAQLGDLPLSEIIRTVEQVEQMKGDVQITAYAADDVYSADQLKLRLAVTPLPTTSAMGMGSASL